jgi:hypothetical protein
MNHQELVEEGVGSGAEGIRDREARDDSRQSRGGPIEREKIIMLSAKKLQLTRKMRVAEPRMMKKRVSKMPV